MLTHRNPQASVSKQASSDNFNPGDVTCEPLLIGSHRQLVEIAPGDAGALTTLLRRMSRIGQRLRPTPWPALPPQSPTVEPSRLATGWVRSATITAPIALLSVRSILLTLGACIATRGAR
jgi:hypothetical protein